MPIESSDPGPLGTAIRRDERADTAALLAEIKVRSPRDGPLVGDRDPARLAATMVEAGASAISVVAESEHFGGSYELVETVATAVDAPVLVKDFVTSTADVDRAVAHGADGVLLISGDLSVERRGALVEYCLDAGVTPLLETHDSEEVAVANDVGAPVVGINNRDIDRLERDDGGVERTERLAPRVHEDAVVVSESSLSSGAEVARAAEAGADAVLVGTSILQADEPATKIDDLLR